MKHSCTYGTMKCPAALGSVALPESTIQNATTCVNIGILDILSNSCFPSFAQAYSCDTVANNSYRLYSCTQYSTGTGYWLEVRFGMEISTSSIRSMKTLQNRYLRYPHFLENREVGFGTYIILK